MTTNTTSVLNDIVAVQLNVTQWTGRKKLDDNDLSLSGEVPPKEIINLGSKHTTDPEALKVFNTLKRRMERTCLSVGIPFLGGYAIPSNKADKMAQTLAGIVGQYELEKTAYLQKHDSIQQDWIRKFPQYEEILRKALTPTADVQNRMSASFSMFKVQSAQATVSVDAGLSNQVDSLGQTLDADILKSSQRLLDSLVNAVQANQNNVITLSKLREKVEGLAFLNGRFAKLVNEIKKVEAAMPLTGKLNNDEVNRLSGLLFRMSDDAKLQALMGSLDLSEQEASQPVEVPLQGDVVFENDDFEFNFGETTVVPNDDFNDFDFDFDDLSISLIDSQTDNFAVKSTFF